MGAEGSLRPDGSRWDQLSLVREADDATRAAIMESGGAPGLEDLVGWELAGINTGWLAGLGGVRKFKKGFFEGPPAPPVRSRSFRATTFRCDVVQVHPDDPELLLGRAYAAVLGMRIPVSYFVLKRMNRHEFGAPPP